MIRYRAEERLPMTCNVAVAARLARGEKP